MLTEYFCSKNRWIWGGCFCHRFSAFYLSVFDVFFPFHMQNKRAWRIKKYLCLPNQSLFFISYMRNPNPFLISGSCLLLCFQPFIGTYSPIIIHLWWHFAKQQAKQAVCYIQGARREENFFTCIHCNIKMMLSILISDIHDHLFLQCLIPRFVCPVHVCFFCF